MCEDLLYAWMLTSQQAQGHGLRCQGKAKAEIRSYKAEAKTEAKISRPRPESGCQS